MMTKQKLKARENSKNLPPNLKVSGFRQTTKRKQGVFEKTTGHTQLSLQCKYFWITIVYFAINICLKIHLLRTKIECLPTIIPPFYYFCRHPMPHRADTPHVWLYTVNSQSGSNLVVTTLSHFIRRTPTYKYTLLWHGFYNTLGTRVKRHR